MLSQANYNKRGAGLSRWLKDLNLVPKCLRQYFSRVRPVAKNWAAKIGWQNLCNKKTLVVGSGGLGFRAILWQAGHAVEPVKIKSA